METAHTPPASPNPTDAVSVADLFDDAMHELTRAGIGFEIITEESPWECAA